MVLEAIFEKGDKIGWIWPFVNIVLPSLLTPKITVRKQIFLKSHEIWGCLEAIFRFLGLIFRGIGHGTP